MSQHADETVRLSQEEYERAFAEFCRRSSEDDDVIPWLSRNATELGLTPVEHVISVGGGSGSFDAELLRFLPALKRYTVFERLTELGRDIIWYPRVSSSTGKIRRFDGSYSQSTSFSLRPFEPPRVPRSTIYAVLFFDRSNCQLETPHALSGGVHVPLASRMCLPGKTNAERKRRQPW